MMKLVTLLSLFALAATVVNAADDDSPTTTIVDLSLDFSPSQDVNDNLGATALANLAATNPLIRTVLILEHGQVVAEYVRDDVDPTTLHQVFSTTKSWIGMLIGVLVQEGLLSVNETLGEIFTDPLVWENDSNTTNTNTTTDTVSYRQAVTIQELLTMTSGLIDPVAGDSNANFMDGGTIGGASLATSLSGPDIAPTRDFAYLATSTILSYVIQERSGMTPRELLADRILPSIGIDNDAFNWWQNAEGMEYSYHGMELTSHQMAKWGQLYLQGGKSNATHQLMDPQWVKSQTSVQTSAYFDFYYGYLTWVYDTNGGVACAAGLGGQDICISPMTDRVIVQQRDLPAWDDATPEEEAEGTASLAMNAMALSPEMVFSSSSSSSSSIGSSTEPTPDDLPAEQPAGDDEEEEEDVDLTNTPDGDDEEGEEDADLTNLVSSGISAALVGAFQPVSSLLFTGISLTILS